MSFQGNFQRQNPPIQPAAQQPEQTEEEKRLAERKRLFEEELKRAQADLKKAGQDVFVRNVVLHN